MAIVRWQPAWPTFWDDSEEFENDLDVYATDDEVVVKAPVPGLKENQIKVTLENGMLRICGENKQEYKFSSFDYETTLPRSIAADKLKAELKDGVLVVTAPIAPESKPKEITVTVKK